MALIWKIKIGAGARQTLEAAGLTLASGNFRTHGVSSMTLRRAVNFDAAESMSYGTAVEISYESGGVDYPYFRGKVASVPKWASGSAEGQDIVVEDAWADLQRTIYQESWNGIAGAKTIPRAVFGMDETGTNRTVGAQAAAVATYGLPDLTVAVSVTGEVPIPSEIVNQTCEEVLLDCLRLHPNWIPWIDHSTTPSTFRITPLASATPISFAVTACADLNITKRDDLIPDSVRIIYEAVDTTDGAAKRAFQEDLYPTTGPTEGPRVISAYIQLQGADTQTMKQRIFTANYPKTEADPTKDWLKAHYPALRDVADANYSIVTVDTEVVPDPADVEDNPTNADDARFPVTSTTPVADLPRELIKGSIEDWMRYRVGEVIVTSRLESNEDATPEELEILGGGVLIVKTRIMATNAPIGSTIRTGVSNYQAGESAPTGIAQSVYEAITAAIPWQGSITVAAEDLPAAAIAGGVLRVTGGVSGWATMDAPINALDWDVASGTATISFGPPEYLAPQDFLELQRTMRRRGTRWFQSDERDSEEMETSGGGSVVGGYDFPQQSSYVPRQGGNFDLIAQEVTEDGDGVMTLTNNNYVCVFRNGLFLGVYAEGGTNPYSDPADTVSQTCLFLGQAAS